MIVKDKHINKQNAGHSIEWGTLLGTLIKNRLEIDTIISKRGNLTKQDQEKFLGMILN